MFNSLTRRDFLKYLGLGSVSAAAASVLAACASGDDEGAAQNIVVDATVADSTSEDYLKVEGETTVVVGEVDETKKTTTTGMNPEERAELFRVACLKTPTNLNPWSSGDHKQYACECLCDWVNAEYQPRLLESYETIDGQYSIAKLKNYIYDWDGNNITADDVVFVYNTYVEGSHTMKFQAYDSCEKVDEYTVKFNWKPEEYKTVGALEKIWCDPVIFSQKAFEERNFAADPCYTAPYKITNYIDGNIMEFEANDDYWETDESKLSVLQHRPVQHFELDVIAEATQHVIALQNDSIDFSASVATENLVYFQEGGEYAENYGVAIMPAGNVYYMLPNFYEGHFTADINFRLACYYAIDNPSIARAVGSSIALTAFANDQTVDTLDPWFTQETYINTYNADLAKEYLAKTNYKGETIYLLGASNEIIKNTTQTVQVLLEAIGVKAELKLLDNSIVNTTQKDPSQWDFYFNWMGGSLWTGAINTQYEQNKYPDIDPLMCNGFLRDDDLIAKFKLARTVEGHTEENIDAVYQHIIENAYQYGIFCSLNNLVYNKQKCASVYMLNGNDPKPIASAYYID